jgi:AAA15 family ATPase/GTPase
MIKHFHLKDYKGISSLELKNLGVINTIIGKNNSGKSSILESMMLNKHYGLGKKDPVSNNILTDFPNIRFY